MFRPQYRITPYLITCFEKIAVQGSLIKQSRVPALLKTDLECEVVNQSVHSSTWIEGNPLSLAQVQAISANKQIIAEDQQKKEVENCLAALRWILKNKMKPLTAPGLLKVHTLMTKGLLQDGRSGQYRKVQNYVIDAKRVVIFTPPPPGQVRLRMSELLAWLKKNQEEHPVVRSALFHHEFVTIHPFVDGNGRVARALAQWLLFHKGYEPLYTFGLDDFFAADRKRYYNMIQQTREMDGDFTYWIEYVAGGLVESIEKIAGRIKAEQATAQKENSITPKQQELLKLLGKHASLSSTDICELMKINRSRVNQLVAPLVRAGKVKKAGKTWGTRYSIKN